MIRSWIKTKTAGALTRTGLDKAIGRFSGSSRGSLRSSRGLVVIGYHRVVEDFASSAATSIPAMLISARMLERHLDSIGRQFRFASLDELAARLDGGDRSTVPLAAVTFDDGYRDFYDVAFPILKCKGIPAAVFVVTDLVGTCDVQIHDKLYLLVSRQPRMGDMVRTLGIPLPCTLPDDPYRALRALIENLSQESLLRLIAALESKDSLSAGAFQPFHSMNWDMIASLQRAGITIGSHTKSHVLMTTESPSRIDDELAGSRHELESRLGTPVRHFAYPSGMFDAPAVRAVRRAGYQFAYTVCNHRDPQDPSLTVPRMLLWERSSCDFRGSFSAEVLSCQLHGAFVNGCRQRHSGQEGGHVRR